ncbi:MAG: hypothetical protein ABSG13_08450 [Bryobacteraceae bacterium]|jgi:hypothetical protein
MALSPAAPGARIRALLMAPTALVSLAAFLLSGRLIFLIWHYSANIPFSDQWDFLSPLFGPHPRISELFLLQQGPPREGVGLVLTAILYHFTSWNVRADSLMIGICVILAMLVALVLKRQLLGPLAYSDALIPVIFLTLSQYDTFLGVPNSSYSAFPLLFIMLYMLALQIPHEAVRCGVLLALNILLIYTGFGFFMGLVTIGVFALALYWSTRQKARTSIALSLAGLLISMASLAIFFINYVFQPAVDCFEFSQTHFGQYLWFVSLMFPTFAGIKSASGLVAVLGGILLLCTLGIIAIQLFRLIVRQTSFRSPSLVIVTLALYSLLFCFSTSVGRACLGLPLAAQSSRYATLLIPVFLAIYFHLLTIPPGALRNSILIVLGLLLLPGHIHLPARLFWETGKKQEWANCYRQAQDIAHCDSITNFAVYPFPERTHLKEKLVYLQTHRLSLFADSQ